MSVDLRPGESQESLLKRFRKAVSESRILPIVRQKRWFTSKSEVRRIKKQKAIRKAQRGPIVKGPRVPGAAGPGNPRGGSSSGGPGGNRGGGGYNSGGGGYSGGGGGYNSGGGGYSGGGNSR